MWELESTTFEKISKGCDSLLLAAKFCKRTVTVGVKVKAGVVV
jgi:hypothetical protein